MAEFTDWTGLIALALAHGMGGPVCEQMLAAAPGAVPDDIADAARAKADGYIFIGASNPASGPFRARARSRILKLAQDGDLAVPMAETFSFAEAPAAFAALS